MHTYTLTHIPLQEGVVSKITDQLRSKLDRNELDDIQTQIRSIVRQPGPEDTEAMLGKVWVMLFYSIQYSHTPLNFLNLTELSNNAFNRTTDSLQYGLSPEEAAGMRKPLNKFNCISCNRPVIADMSKPAAPGMCMRLGQ